MSGTEKRRGLGHGRWLLVDVDREQVFDLRGEPVLVERVREGRTWTDGLVTQIGPDVTDEVRVEMRLVPVDGSHYTLWFPREALSEAIGVLVVEVDS